MGGRRDAGRAHQPAQQQGAAVAGSMARRRPCFTAAVPLLLCLKREASSEGLDGGLAVQPVGSCCGAPGRYCHHVVQVPVHRGHSRSKASL